MAGLGINLNGFVVYRGLIPGHEYPFAAVTAIELVRRRYNHQDYLFLYIETKTKRFWAGNEDDFTALKLSLERVCRVEMESEKMVSSLGINEGYGTQPAPIDRKYYCHWGELDTK